jgi:hypothetical protein
LVHGIILIQINRVTNMRFATSPATKTRGSEAFSSESSSLRRKLACFRHGISQNCIEVRSAVPGEQLVHRIPLSFTTHQKDRLLTAADYGAED